jgi:4'-phosphopantetheinyl transferase EntD
MALFPEHISEYTRKNFVRKIARLIQSEGHSAGIPVKALAKHKTKLVQGRMCGCIVLFGNTIHDQPRHHDSRRQPAWTIVGLVRLVHVVSSRMPAKYHGTHFW